MSGFQIIDIDTGICVATHDQRWTALALDGDVLSAVGSDRVPNPSDPTRRSLSIADSRAEIDMVPSEVTVTVGNEITGIDELVLCHVAGGVDGAGRHAEISAPGVSTTTIDEPRESTGVRRSMTIALSDGGLLAIKTSSDGISPHSAEASDVAMAGPKSADLTGAETLVSTEFDADGVPRRVTLEIWQDPELGDRPLRGAGQLISSTTLDLPGERVVVAFFHWSVNDREGGGVYEIRRQS